MRLVTWNCCRGKWENKVPLLEPLAADIAVIQECPRPNAESESCLWFGDNERQGIAVVTSGSYRLQRLPVPEGLPKFVVPVSVQGAASFLLIAVWSKGAQRFNYVEAVVQAVHMLRDHMESNPTVLVGDLNSSVIWNADHPEHLNHTALVQLLSDLKMISAYHCFYQEPQGMETRPTYFFHWKETRPYHIDYCFIPEAWVGALRKVEVGSFEDWKGHSDHRPLLIEVSTSAA